jgi:predicted PurR-regulated permease PerM
MQEPLINYRRRRSIVLLLTTLIVLAILSALFFLNSSSNQPTPSSAKEATASVISWLPVETSHYKITYSFDQQTQIFNYKITLYAIINQPSQYNSYLEQLKKYKQEALSYITSKGANPSKLNIQYLPPDAASL